MPVPDIGSSVVLVSHCLCKGWPRHWSSISRGLAVQGFVTLLTIAVGIGFRPPPGSSNPSANRLACWRPALWR